MRFCIEMNKKILVLALALIGVGAFSYQAKAEDGSIGLSLEVGADLVSNYLWRGQNLGGVSIQPSVTLDWKGLYVCGWANIGADSWKFQELSPELDITIGYDNYGFMLDLGSHFLDPLEHSLRKHTLPTLNDFTIQISTSSEAIMPLGAVANIFSSYLRTDDYRWVYSL